MTCSPIGDVRYTYTQVKSYIHDSKTVGYEKSLMIKIETILRICKSHYLIRGFVKSHKTET